MELRGVEPLASSMRPRRSSQLSYSPQGTVTVPAVCWIVTGETVTRSGSAPAAVGAGREELLVARSRVDRQVPGAVELDALRVFLEATARGSEESLKTQIERLGSEVGIKITRAESETRH